MSKELDELKGNLRTAAASVTSTDPAALESSSDLAAVESSSDLAALESSTDPAVLETSHFEPSFSCPEVAVQAILEALRNSEFLTAVRTIRECR